MTDAYDRPLYADDIAIGDTSPEITVENLQRRDFVKYAGASGDFYPIHYDEPFAKSAGNPSVFGHGMLTAGIAAHMLADWFGLNRIERFRIRFESRLWPGDTVTAKGEVSSCLEIKEGLRVEADITLTNQNEETLATGDVTAELPAKKRC